MHTRSWEGQDGQQHSRTEVIANKVIFLDRRGSAPLPDEKGEEGVSSGSTDLEPDDIPF